MFLSSSPRIGPAAATTLLLALCLIAAGCNNPRVPYTPPVNAYALSGGKIKHFTPTPGLPNDPGDKMLLAAVGFSHIKGSVARSAIITFQSSTGNNSVGCLMVGKNVLVILEDFTRQAFGWGEFSAGPGSLETVAGPPYNGKPFLETKQGQLYLYRNSQQYIQISPNETTALVGGKRVQLNHPVLWQDGKHPLMGDHVILLSDLLRLFQERDKQVGSGISVRNVRIIYDIRDYHR